MQKNCNKRNAPDRFSIIRRIRLTGAVCYGTLHMSYAEIIRTNTTIAIDIASRPAAFRNRFSGYISAKES